MLFLTSLILSATLSIDALGIGIAYGIRRIKLTPFAAVIISVISFVFSFISVLAGKFLLIFLSPSLAKAIGISLLALMGLYFIFQGISDHIPSFLKKHKKKNILSDILPKKSRYYLRNIFSVLTRILKTPEYSDLDRSGKIEAKEALYLGTALSVDILSAGIGISALGASSLLLPVYIAAFQLIFLFIGSYLGSGFLRRSMDDNVCMIFSGLVLLFISVFHIFS